MACIKETYATEGLRAFWRGGSHLIFACCLKASNVPNNLSQISLAYPELLKIARRLSCYHSKLFVIEASHSGFCLMDAMADLS